MGFWSGLANWLNDAVGIGSLIISVKFPALRPIADAIAGAIGAVEVAITGEKMGATKLAAVESIIPAAANLANTLAGKTVVDPMAIGQDVKGAVAAVVKIANDFNPKPATPDAPPAPPAPPVV